MFSIITSYPYQGRKLIELSGPHTKGRHENRREAF